MNGKTAGHDKRVYWHQCQQKLILRGIAEPAYEHLLNLLAEQFENLSESLLYPPPQCVSDEACVESGSFSMYLVTFAKRRK